MDDAAVEKRLAIATSAARDASDSEAFFDLAESALGVRPTLITGEVEARLAFAGATAGSDLEPPVVVSDIGGGSTEFVTADTAVSIDIGSVRLTERSIPSRPAPAAELDAARDLVGRLFEAVDLEARTLIGVAGTWTSLAAVALDLPEYSRNLVDGYPMQKETLTAVVESLSVKSVEETAAIPSLDPKRAPVILAGSLVAEGVMNVLGAERVLVSEHDSLDGAAMELLALP
jgi:exopolyphosphatase/guanosine-5'-triphosphate,3'-diphosphate pyrophosphatase